MLKVKREKKIWSLQRGRFFKRKIDDSALRQRDRGKKTELPMTFVSSLLFFFFLRIKEIQCSFGEK